MDKVPMKNLLVSIIIPVFNVELYINKCLASIVHQTYENIEIILINDGSTDNSLDVCNTWATQDSRIRVINQVNSGPSNARNRGILESKGDWILFVDSDDYISFDAVEILVSYIKDGIGLIEGNTRFWASNKFDYYDSTFFRNPRTVKSSNLFCLFYYCKILISPWNKLIRRDIVENSLFAPYRFGEDVKFVLDISMYMEKRHLDLIQVPNILYFYSINPSGTMQSRTARLRIDSRILIFEEATKYYNSFGHARSRRIYIDMWEEILTIGREFDDKNSCLYGKEELRSEWKLFEKGLPLENFRDAKVFFSVWLFEKRFIFLLGGVGEKINYAIGKFVKRCYLFYMRRVLKEQV